MLRFWADPFESSARSLHRTVDRVEKRLRDACEAPSRRHATPRQWHGREDPLSLEASRSPGSDIEGGQNHRDVGMGVVVFSRFVVFFRQEGVCRKTLAGRHSQEDVQVRRFHQTRTGRWRRRGRRGRRTSDPFPIRDRQNRQPKVVAMTTTDTHTLSLLRPPSQVPCRSDEEEKKRKEKFLLCRYVRSSGCVSRTVDRARTYDLGVISTTL